MPATVSTFAVAASHATGRQRGEGSRPSGNSSSPNVAAGPMPAIQTQVPSHMTSGGCELPPGESSIASPPIAYDAPAPSRIQPIGLPGCREAISAPIVANARMKTV